MTARPLPSSTPAAQGVDATGVLAFLDAVEAEPDLELHSLMILRHGHVVTAGWWSPYTRERPHLLYSLSKSFTGTAAAFALADGLFGLDDEVLAHFPEFEADITDPRSRAIRVRHVATMSSGHLAETVDDAYRTDPAEPVRGFLLQPPQRDPGTVFAYNQPTTYTLGAIVQKRTGQPLSRYLRPRLFDPLGIDEAAGWLWDGAGRELGFSGLHLTTESVARFGELYLRDGVWQGRRLLPEGWVAEAGRAHVPTASRMFDSGSPDWDQGYGIQFWRSRHGYRGDGAYGQFCLVLPEQDAVIVTTAATERMQTLLDLFWQHVLPAFHPAPLPGPSDADAALAHRLTGLALPPATGKPAPPERPEDWAAVPFTPHGGVCAAQPGLTGLEVTPGAGGAGGGDGTGGWTVTFTENGHRLALRLGAGGWTVAEEPLPVAVSGGWTGSGTLAFEVLFLETPHRLVVTCSLADRTFTADWRHTPLHHPPLGLLRAPVGPRA
ncbi:serine hydrolase domain-containing protein [Streptomyces sp. enrichment culture]|uniref:serine hydrolase domain-containing protein n=1 Tax=Streptomyces sp. enrichment culture TaxID=1795815 RepID=UPI003F563C9A